MPRFVILTHDHPTLHWDLMLEDSEASTLRTWRLLSEPDSADEIVAEPLPPHRIEYLDYEGPVSGNRGHVQQWDSGEYEIIESSTDNREPSGTLRIRLNGQRLSGTYAIAKNGQGILFQRQ